MKTTTIQMTKQEINQLREKYKHCEIRTGIQYTYFQIKGSDFTITAYTSGKVVFQGDNLPLHAHNLKEVKPVNTKQDMAGSDEVGTGDYFGPVVVCAALVRLEDIERLPINRIMDTKEMKDTDILEVAPLLMNQLNYSLQVLTNAKYNIVHRTNNLNEIKAKLHNQAFIHLRDKAFLPSLTVIDQFVKPESYYKHLMHEKEVIRTLHFETKAENKYLAVACAAIIARYAFLKEFERMNDEFDFDFPKGAGVKVDDAGKAFIKIHGVAALDRVAKVHFINTKRITQDALD